MDVHNIDLSLTIQTVRQLVRMSEEVINDVAADRQEGGNAKVPEWAHEIQAKLGAYYYGN